jgi:hypothetical protein
VHLRVVGWFRMEDSVGGTPTEAVKTTALPENSPMIGVSGFILPTNQRCADGGPGCPLPLLPGPLNPSS